ncbi:MAG: efflux transporter outer membrane subunit [Verrucomicrobiota bacterium]|jgi:multidrug efflux system outer membrane protein
MKVSRLLLFCSVAALLASSCALGPNYKKPDLSTLTPSDWSWAPAVPRDAAPKGPWWQIFHDTTLDQLETNGLAGSQTLRAAVARVDQARAAARLSRGQFFPQLSLDPAYEYQQTSGNLPTPIPFHIPQARFQSFSVPLDLSYEVDLWGKVRRGFESARADAQASAADFQNVLLTLTADVAVDYFLLRSLDGEVAAFRGTVATREQSARLLRARFQAGAIAELDAVQAETELAASQSDLADAIRQRAETLHALALLCGQSATSFSLPDQPLPGPPPPVPADLPASVLERRPDIAAAERTLASRNARIGVAQAAYFPAISLTGQGGFLSASADKLFTGASGVWSIGPSLSLPVFTGGRTKANVNQARAARDEAVANYRQTVLAAIKEVEDSLTQIHSRDEQAAAVDRAVDSARRQVELSNARYARGASTYLPVADAERALRQEQLLQAQSRGERYAASVRFIKALGGGWGTNVQFTRSN